MTTIKGPWVIHDDGDTEFIGDYEVWIEHPTGEDGGQITCATWRDLAPAIVLLPELIEMLRGAFGLINVAESGGGVRSAQWNRDAQEWLPSARSILARLEEG